MMSASASASGPTLPERKFGWCRAIALDSSSTALPSEEAEFEDEVLAHGRQLRERILWCYRWTRAVCLSNLW